MTSEIHGGLLCEALTVEALMLDANRIGVHRAGLIVKAVAPFPVRPFVYLASDEDILAFGNTVKRIAEQSVKDAQKARQLDQKR